jgi:serine protease SohB
LEFLANYGLFLAKSLTVLAAILVVIMVVVATGTKTRRVSRGHIEIKKVNDVVKAMEDTLIETVLDDDARKALQKAEKQKDKAESKARKKAQKKGDAKQGDQDQPQREGRTYVVEFEGDVQASAASQLREEITAILTLAETVDEVVVKVESPGGMVHSYGLAASQLKRIVDRGISLTVAVDKVAASGGYLMACIANKIIAAPFALLGSIGVVAQVPNFHRLLKKNEIDVEVLTAGEYKRTLTIFGENTDKGREKFVEELENVHTLFKNFVAENRPAVDIVNVATGEAWYGSDAIKRNLVDELRTSDDYITEQCQSRDVFQVKYVEDKSKVDKLMERISMAVSSAIERSLEKMTQDRNLFK